MRKSLYSRRSVSTSTKVDLVGPPVGTHTCTFTSGAGNLTYAVSAGTLAVATDARLSQPRLASRAASAHHGRDVQCHIWRCLTSLRPDGKPEPLDLGRRGRHWR